MVYFIYTGESSGICIILWEQKNILKSTSKTLDNVEKVQGKGQSEDAAQVDEKMFRGGISQPMRTHFKKELGPMGEWHIKASISTFYCG